MKTIKIIDLLNKIANGEEVPKKIILFNVEWEHIGYQYRRVDEENQGNIWNGYNFNILNQQVEIIEEKKLPEKINVKGSYNSNKGFEDFNDNEKILVDKINDLLDYLESKEKGE